MKKRERSEPKRLTPVLKEILGEAEKKCGNSFSAITIAWNKCVDEKIRSHAKLQKINNDTLFVTVDTSTWLYEIERKYKSDIIQKLQKEVGESTITKIILTIG